MMNSLTAETYGHRDTREDLEAMAHHTITRRDALRVLAASSTTIAAPRIALAADAAQSRMRFGLVTYLWGDDWPLAELLTRCESAGLFGVELRTEHAHGVDPEIGAQQRREARSMVADSPVECVGLGSNEQFDSPDPNLLTKAIARTKEFLQLSHDVGGSGVKVKPNNLHKHVPREETISQIGESLNELARFGADLDQEVRLEVHGRCAELPTIAQIMEIADHPNARVCWNSNPEDLIGQGLEHNFRLVRPCFGDTAHVRELNIGEYPYADLMRLFVDTDYRGWVLLEARTRPADRVAAMIEQRRIWERMVADASRSPRQAAQRSAIN